MKDFGVRVSRESVDIFSRENVGSVSPHFKSSTGKLWDLPGAPRMHTLLGACTGHMWISSE